MAHLGVPKSTRGLRFLLNCILVCSGTQLSLLYTAIGAQPGGITSRRVCFPEDGCGSS